MDAVNRPKNPSFMFNSVHPIIGEVYASERDYPTPPGHRNLRESELLSSEKSDDKNSPDNRVVQQTITDFDANIRDCLPPSKASLR